MRRHVLITCPGREGRQGQLVSRHDAQRTQRFGREAAPGSAFAHAVANLRRPIIDLVQIESPQNRPEFVDHDVVGARTGVLLVQTRSMVFGEVLEVGVAAISDGGGEEVPILGFECEDSVDVVAPKAF